MKKVLMVLLLVFAAVSLTSCSKVTGTWKLKSIEVLGQEVEVGEDVMGVVLEEDTYSIKFNMNNTGEFIDNEDGVKVTVEFEWVENEDGTISITTTDGQKWTAEIDNDYLELQYGSGWNLMIIRFTK